MAEYAVIAALAAPATSLKNGWDKSNFAGTVEGHAQADQVAYSIKDMQTRIKQMRALIKAAEKLLVARGYTILTDRGDVVKIYDADDSKNIFEFDTKGLPTISISVDA